MFHWQGAVRGQQFSTKRSVSSFGGTGALRETPQSPQLSETIFLVTPPIAWSKVLTTRLNVADGCERVRNVVLADAHAKSKNTMRFIRHY